MFCQAISADNRLGLYQLRRLHRALSVRATAKSERYQRLANRCIFSIYLDCIEAGMGDEARRAINRATIGR